MPQFNLLSACSFSYIQMTFYMLCNSSIKLCYINTIVIDCNNVLKVVTKLTRYEKFYK